MRITGTKSIYSIKCLFITVVVLVLLGGPSTEAEVDENTVAGLAL